MFEYAPAPESRALVTFQSSYGHFIGGKFTKPSNTYQTISPATEQVLAEISTASAKDVDLAVKAARSAYEKVWSKLSGAERGKYLYRIARIIQERARELAIAETLNNGKPIKETRDADIPLVAAWFFYYAGWADKLDYAGLGVNPKAHGVAAQVIPWNFPLMMLAWKIAPALAAGNTVVLKPAENNSAYRITICRDLPAGRSARWCCEHHHRLWPNWSRPDCSQGCQQGCLHWFHWSWKTNCQAGCWNKQEGHLELGGKAANIVFDDAPLDQAVEGIINGIFFNQGHVCCAGSRLLVQESIQDELMKKLKRRMETLKLGDPLDKNTDIGAINSKVQLDKITKLVKLGVKEGGEAWAPNCEIPKKGFWYAPTVITGVAPTNTVAREEIFGPVLSVLTFRTPAEAVAKANNTPFGLSAGIWTEKGSRILKVADQLNAGVIWANTFNQFDPASPFGGFKESGYGREGGRHGLLAYLKGDN
jgi:aldehyde dehydrogenase (NAD+)